MLGDFYDSKNYSKILFYYSFLLDQKIVFFAIDRSPDFLNGYTENIFMILQTLDDTLFVNTLKKINKISCFCTEKLFKEFQSK